MLIPLAFAAFAGFALPPAAPDRHAASSDSLLVPGVSRQLAEYRAARIHDVRYNLKLDLSSRDTAIGLGVRARSRRVACW